MANSKTEAGGEGELELPWPDLGRELQTRNWTKPKGCIIIAQKLW
jgi:hypothetical protein